MGIVASKFIPVHIISVNDVLYGSKTFFTGSGRRIHVNKKYKDYRDNVFDQVSKCIGRPPWEKPDPKSFLEIKMVSVRSRNLDFGNLVFGCKPILDGLKNNGWFVDDTPRYIRERYQQKTGMNKYFHGTYIEIIEACPYEHPLLDPDTLREMRDEFEDRF